VWQELESICADASTSQSGAAAAAAKTDRSRRCTPAGPAVSALETPRRSAPSDDHEHGGRLRQWTAPLSPESLIKFANQTEGDIPSEFERLDGRPALRVSA